MFFHAASDQRLLAAKRLRAEGFEVLDIGSASVNIAAPPEVYERALGANLELIERPTVGDIGHQGIASYINSVDQTPFGEIDISDKSWHDLLDGVAINEPAYYLQQVMPSATPPQTNTRYLQVPHDLAEELNASLAHAKGVTGEGIQVVAIDTGCYTDHPFFKRHNYNLNVVLGPGSSEPDLDANGHGTGIAANVFAIAPHANLTVLKADIALKNKYRNVNSAAAFRKAISLRPDVISCSWGTDLRSPFQLSAYHKVLAAAIADAIRQGIVVIFAAGNGQWGFPSQHPDVIAVGGVYKHLEGSLKGRLEASNYASSFISAIYPGRRVPDICGLVGQLPNAAYIMLPVPPGSQTDSSRAATGDETEKADGWAAFSGTSSAAPQLAGACALLEQYVPGLGPLKIKQLLQETAEDILEGSSNPASGSGGARAGPDLATGYGLAVAHKAIEAARKAQNSQPQNSIAFYQTSIESTLPNNTNIRQDAENLNQISYHTGVQNMSLGDLTLQNLRKKIDEIQIDLNNHLKELVKNEPELSGIELLINEVNFVSRSPESDSLSALLQILRETFSEKGVVQKQLIRKRHVSAAESLLKQHKCQEIARKVLIEAMNLKGKVVKFTLSSEAKNLENNRNLVEIPHQEISAEDFRNLEIDEIDEKGTYILKNVKANHSFDLNITVNNHEERRKFTFLPEETQEDLLVNSIVTRYVLDLDEIAELAAKALGEFRGSLHKIAPDNPLTGRKQCFFDENNKCLYCVDSKGERVSC
ncbi:MAG: S8 family serine peptidase [Elainellaceae cyanobacterium]